MANNGKALQDVVKTIEQATHTNAGVVIESPKRLRDKDTGRLREHDVVLTFIHEHHELVMSIECRDRSRKVGVNAIEGFHLKCLRTGIDRGLFVSPLGFTEPALKKAASCNIGCLSLQEATDFNWLLAPGVDFIRRDIMSSEVTIYPEIDVTGEYAIFSKDGDELSDADFAKIGAGCLIKSPKDSIEKETGEYTRNFADTSTQMYLLSEEGEKIGVSVVTCTVRFRLKREFIPFDFHEYVDMAKGHKISNAAIAKLKNIDGDHDGELVILHTEGKDTTYSLVSNGNTLVTSSISNEVYRPAKSEGI